MRRASGGWALAVFVLVFAGAARAQVERFEVGQRLLAFERAVEANPDAAARRRALPDLKQATVFFLTEQIREAGRLLDRSRLCLLSEKEPDAASVWASSLTVRTDGRLLDGATAELPLTVTTTYKVDEGRSDKVRVRCALVRVGDKTPAVTATLAVGDLPMEAKLPLKGLKEGDYILSSETLLDGRPVLKTETMVSLADRLDERLEKLQVAVKALPAKPRPTGGETLCSLTALLGNLRQKKILETNFPATRLLAEAEALSRALDGDKPFYGPERKGQFWLTLATEGRPTPVRILVPEEILRGKPVPLVIALHGAGGSENLFFDGYGNGRIARICAERGWLLVAPRGGLPTGLIEEIRKLYPVDEKRVYIIGHSLGAAQAVAAAGRMPERIAGVAALGGSGGFARSDALKAVPFFVGVGKEDFALTGARGLAQNLQKAGVATVVLREYPDVEHLLVVQLGLGDVFAFFDDTAKR